MQSNGMQLVGDTGSVAETAPLLFRTLNWGAMPVTAPEPEHALPPTVDVPGVVEAAREAGRREAAIHLQEMMERRLHAERENVATALDSFLAEKRRYFSGLEKEVVRLALAIAERVLHRETAMDPTLLAGAARVVLEQVDQDSAAALLVAPGDAAQWHAAVAKLGREIELREDPSLERGACLLQTENGSFELGLRSQLCEIERGFFELMGRTPAIAV